MTTGPEPRIRMPDTAKPGETVTIRTMIAHPMESGLRKDDQGRLIARKILNRFTCTFRGEAVVDVAIEPAVSANPVFEFDAMVHEAGDFIFTWHDDDGTVHRHARSIAIL